MTLNRFRAAAELVSEALPFITRYAGGTVVIKYGGAAMGHEELAEHFARDIVLLRQVGINPVVVHGGGPQIGRMLERLGIETRFVDGLRVTDAATLEVAEMVLSGSINKQIALDITRRGARAVGISGKDAAILRVRQRDPALGFVGDPVAVDTQPLGDLISRGLVPVVAPIGVDESGQGYNVNADTAAGAIAAALGAERLLLLTDVPGVLDANRQLIAELTLADVTRLIGDGTISGGMIPKVRTCVDAVEGGVKAAVILDGREPHAILVEMFTEGGIGTLIRSSPAQAV